MYHNRRPTKKRSRSQSPSSTPPSAPPAPPARSDVTMTTSPTTSLSLGPTPQSHVDPTELLLPSIPQNPPSPGPIFGSIFGSARQTLQAIEFDYTLPPSRTRPSSPGPGQLPSTAQVEQQQPPLSQASNAQLSLDPVTWPTGLKPPSSTVQPPPVPPYSPSTTLADLVAASDAASSTITPAAPGAPTIDISRIESFASWDEIGFFLSLHMKHQHMLVPLVHRPSFAQDVLHRRDENDEAFRGLLLSMGEPSSLPASY